MLAEYRQIKEEGHLGTVVHHYRILITNLVRKAKTCGHLSCEEADYLLTKSQQVSHGETSTTADGIIGAPDFLYTVLYFATRIWHQGETAEDDLQARAGYLLAQFALMQDSPEHDPYWTAKLLRELFDAHREEPAVALSSSELI